MKTDQDSEETPDLCADVARDSAFVDALQDLRFARAFYMVLADPNHIFVKGDNPRTWGITDDRGAGFIRELRETCEDDYCFHMDEFPGVWPDDRQEREARVLADIERHSRPIEFEFDESLPFKALVNGDLVTIDTQEVLSRYRKYREEMFVAMRPELEATRQRDLRLARKYLAWLRSDENGDVFRAVHAHLTRIGWRTKTSEDYKP